MANTLLWTDVGVWDTVSIFRTEAGAGLMGLDGRIEILSTRFAMGWVEVSGNSPSFVVASLSGEILGVARADQTRADLDEAGALHGFLGRAFCITYGRAMLAAEVAEVEIRVMPGNDLVPKDDKVRFDMSPVRQIFILGSPRSGTSELGNTLSTVLGLPWLGEGHAVPLFAGAADLLAGDAHSPSDMVRFMAAQGLRKLALDCTRMAYYSMHGSSSFLDKTPGVPMIQAAPFLLECFPDARFIYLRRNGISNVLSRMAKFGGDFEEHCMDWAAAINSWVEVRKTLSHYLELWQEDMLDKPHEVALRVSTYLRVPEMALPVGAGLATGSTERTGAGLKRAGLQETGWSDAQKGVFVNTCSTTMAQLGLPLRNDENHFDLITDSAFSSIISESETLS